MGRGKSWDNCILPAGTSSDGREGHREETGKKRDHKGKAEPGLSDAPCWRSPSTQRHLQQCRTNPTVGHRGWGSSTRWQSPQNQSEVVGKAAAGTHLPAGVLPAGMGTATGSLQNPVGRACSVQAALGELCQELGGKGSWSWVLAPLVGPGSVWNLSCLHPASVQPLEDTQTESPQLGCLHRSTEAESNPGGKERGEGRQRGNRGKMGTLRSRGVTVPAA